MWAIHDDVRAGWKTLDEALATGPGEDLSIYEVRIDALFETLDGNIREMFYKEESILFPTALEKLSEKEWVEIRAQESEVGYCYVEPGDQWPSQAVLREVTPADIKRFGYEAAVTAVLKRFGIILNPMKDVNCCGAQYVESVHGVATPACGSSAGPEPPGPERADPCHELKGAAGTANVSGVGERF